MRTSSVQGLVASALLVAACSKGSGGGTVTTVEGGSAAKPSASTAPATPMMKEFSATPAERLGKLAPGTGIAVGERVPSVAATDLDGHRVELADMIAKGPILLVFYRGGWCPYCNFEIHELTKAYPDYERRSVTPVAISVDKPDEASKTQATYTIPFPVLSDPDLTVHEAFHVLHHADDAEVARLKGFGIDIERSSGRTHHTFAIPALFLIDRQGVVRWAHTDPEYKVRPTTPQILAAIDAAKL